MRVGSVNGPLATLQEIRAVLQRVTRLGIRMTGYVAPFPVRALDLGAGFERLRTATVWLILIQIMDNRRDIQA